LEGLVIGDAAAANRLRWLALLLMLAMIAIGGLAFYHSLNHPEIDWRLFAFRLGTTIVIAVPAFYAAQESARHRERERQNRKLQEATNEYRDLRERISRLEAALSFDADFYRPHIDALEQSIGGPRSVDRARIENGGDE